MTNCSHCSYSFHFFLLNRLVSAYRDKFLDSKSTVYQERIGREIIRQYRVNASEASLANGDDVSFPEFVHYVIERWATGRDLDVHWRPMTSLCLPCSIDYQFIGHFETLGSDVDFLMRKVGFSLKSSGQPIIPTTTPLQIKQAMEQLSPILVNGLLRLYKDDFKLFGYSERFSMM